jgi:hypothetical protein
LILLPKPIAPTEGGKAANAHGAGGERMLCHRTSGTISKTAFIAGWNAEEFHLSGWERYSSRVWRWRN